LMLALRIRTAFLLPIILGRPLAENAPF
jgi:hypothetical protein